MTASKIKDLEHTPVMRQYFNDDVYALDLKEFPILACPIHNAYYEFSVPLEVGKNELVLDSKLSQ